jgi:hypothetical protein
MEADGRRAVAGKACEYAKKSAPGERWMRYVLMPGMNKE